MSAILEEGIGFGGNDVKSSPQPAPQLPQSFPARIEKWTFDEVEKEMVASGKKYVSEQVNTLVEKEVQRRNSEIVANKKLEEVKQMMHSFKEKVANYPKHMSYEGSMVLCVLLSMKKVAVVNMRSIPSVDQTLIRSLLPEEIDLSGFDVKFDENKDFVLIFNPQDNKNITLTLFNTVAHPRPTDLKDTGDVPVENVGEKISIGGKVYLNKRDIQKLGGIEPRDRKTEDTEEKQYAPPKQSGRNAYEIRADVLQMAIDWSKTDKHKNATDDDVVALAKKFYAFVENRR
jgi:hypothetical protein